MLEVKGIQLSVWDLGGQKTLRQYWSNYYKKTHALIYVVDSADEDRLEEAGKELKELLQSEGLKEVPVLIFANKQDLTHAIDAGEIQDKLGLDKITDRKWMIIACSAMDKSGLEEGFSWVIQNLKRN